MKDPGKEVSRDPLSSRNAAEKPSNPQGYAGLAHYYADLFPVSEPLKDFLAPRVEKCIEQGLPWLDVGSGTGALVGWLGGQGVAAFGLDPDRDFVDEANRLLESTEAIVAPGSMTDWGPFSGKTFGAITCLGNVAAHAADIRELEVFAGMCARSLAPTGAVFLQTVNFDRVLGNSEWEFPILERVASDGKHLRFFREYLPEGDRLRFKTRLEIEGASSRVNETSLLPLTREEVERTLHGAFEEVEVFGSFLGGAWETSSPATILRGQVPRS